MSNQHDFISRCKKEIICKFFGSDEFNLKYSDLLRLSEEIYLITGISISLSTLRRIFKKDYNSIPQVSTLNAFAKYLGHESWKDYVKNYTLEQGQKRKRYYTGFKIKKLTLLIAALSFLFAASIILIVNYRWINKVNYDDIEFHCKKFNNKEMPVTVFFTYNLKGIKCDSATIRPLGRPTRKYGDEFGIDPSDSIASYNYLWPETFVAKLTVDGVVVKKLKINLETQKWKVAVTNNIDGFYVKYFDDKELYGNGKMTFSDQVLEQHNFSKSQIEKTVFNLFRKFKKIDGDSLSFETRFRSIPLVRRQESGSVFLTLFFTRNRINIPLAIQKSLFGEKKMKAFNQVESSKNSDLSFLYLNLEEWNKFKISTFNKQFNLYLNDSLVYQTNYNKDPGKLTGLRFIFNGIGELDYVRFYNSMNELVYNDEFE